MKINAAAPKRRSPPHGGSGTKTHYNFVAPPCLGEALRRGILIIAMIFPEIRQTGADRNSFLPESPDCRHRFPQIHFLLQSKGKLEYQRTMPLKLPVRVWKRSGYISGSRSGENLIGKFSFSSLLLTGHCASFGNVISLPAAQGLAAEVPAGSRAGIVDGTAPLPFPAFVRLVLAQVPARGIDKEKAARFLKTPFTEVLQLVGFALGDRDKGEPAAAFPTAAAGTSRWGRLCRFH